MGAGEADLKGDHVEHPREGEGPRRGLRRQAEGNCGSRVLTAGLEELGKVHGWRRAAGRRCGDSNDLCKGYERRIAGS